MKMTSRIALLWLAIGLAGPVMAQTADPEEDATEAPAETTETAAAGEEEEALPDIDIWSEESADDEDVFIPTERISADANIAYPADI
jgi:hypothetical protein